MLDRVRPDSVTRDTSSDLPICFEAVTFQAGPCTVLETIAVDLAPGAPTVLLGPNGAGKTTFLRLAKGLIAPTAGSIRYAGRASPAPGRHAFVFQKPVMLRRTAAANIAFALTATGRRADGQAVDALLELVGLAGHGARPARRLSGGEQQRLALARALARAPQVLFLDEPTASLDPAATKAVEDIVARVAAAGVKVVMATHDLGQARRLAGDIIFLAGGRVIEHAAAVPFFSMPATEEARRFLAGDLVI